MKSRSERNRLLSFLPNQLAKQLIADPAESYKPNIELLHGAILFADISGFTPLTEALTDAGQEGPEELTRILNHYFSTLINTLAETSGDVIKFSGDALMVMFVAQEQTLGIAVRRADQAAQCLHQVISDLSHTHTSVGELRLKVKIGIGAGRVMGMQVGGILDRWEYLIAGEAVTQAAKAEENTLPGSVELSEEAAAMIHPEAVQPAPEPKLELPAGDRRSLVEKAFSRYVPGAAMGWLNQQSQSWLSVLRPMTVLFISCRQIEFERQADGDRLHKLVREVQHELYRFEGSLNKVAVDDKGLLIIALFGAPPFAHQDDALRGCKAAMAMIHKASQSKIDLSIGVTTGTAFAGLVGNPQRCEYTVIGDNVNLAARLMKLAKPGQIICDHVTYLAARFRVKMLPSQPVAVKGKSIPVEAYLVDDQKLTARLSRDRMRIPEKILGRELECATIASSLDRVVDGAGGVLLFDGDVGIGKTRLLDEVMMQAKLKGVQVMRGSGRRGNSKIPLRPWQSIFESFFNIRAEQDPQYRFEQVQHSLQLLAPNLLEQISLLKSWFNLDLPAGTMEIIVDPELLENSVVQLLDTLLSASLVQRPMLIIMDDLQYLDIRSWRLLTHIARLHCKRGSPLLVGAAMGHMEQSNQCFEFYQELQELENCIILEVTRLKSDNLILLLSQQLKLKPEKIPVRLIQFVEQRSKGVPFIALELIRTLLDQGVVEIWADRQSKQSHCRIRGDLNASDDNIPDSVRGMLQSRMDKLDSSEQLVLKLAAILGQRFEFDCLQYLYIQGVGEDQQRLEEQLERFCQLGLLEQVELESELSYRFSHPIIHQVAYDSMLFSQRREMHLLAAQWYEQQITATLPELAADKFNALLEKTISPVIEDVVRHYRTARDHVNLLRFLILAARRTRDLFQNEEAISHLTEALGLLAEDAYDQRFELLSALEGIQSSLSKQSACKRLLAQMSELASKCDDQMMVTRVTIRQADFELSYGRPELAAEMAEMALAYLSQSAVGYYSLDARMMLSRALLKTGDHIRAQTEMEKAYALAEQNKNWRSQVVCLTQLAAYAERRGDYSNCLSLCQQALQLTDEHKDLRQQARILRLDASAKLALHEVSEARKTAEEAARLQEQIDDQYESCITRDLLGRIALAQGDLVESRALFEKNLGIRQGLDDRHGELQSLTLLGAVCTILGAYDKARICYQQALEDATELGLVYDQAEINARLVLLEHGVGDNEKARQHGLEAAKSVSKLDHPALLATVLTNLGHAFAELDLDDSASAAYANAIRIRKQLGQPLLMLEAVAGSAKIDLKQGRRQAVKGKLEEIVKQVEQNALLGSDQRFKIFQTCYELMHELNDERAISLIELAHEQLESAAEAISNMRLREEFKQNVLENRTIMYYYRQRMNYS